jgi:hypothetical protein
MLLPKKWRAVLFPVAVVALAATSSGARAVEQNPKPQPPNVQKEKKIDPEADRLLRQMTDYLAGLQNFKVRSEAIDEVVTKDGQKIQVASQSDVAVSRPNKIRSERLGEESGAVLYNDGKNMSLFCKADNTYATVPAPANLDASIDMLRQKYHADAPGADLLYSKPYDVLTEQVTGGQLVGRETVDGKPVNHLAFRGDTVDWQVWIQEGAQPLPLRFVVTSKDVKNMPQFTAEFSQWEPQAQLPDNMFQFTAPQGAKKVDTLPVNCGLVGKAKQMK